jgi:REP element-mobilizing transposase RayT
MPDHPIRKTVRLRGHDYASPCAYFVTVCTCDRIGLLGTIEQEHVVLSPEGEIVHVVWRDLPRHFPGIEIDALVVMPNHLHAILILQPAVGAKNPAGPDASPLPVPSRPRGTQSRSIPAIVQNAKSISARRINLLRGTPRAPVWQRGYFEHVVRSMRELDRLRAYIDSNPLRRALDREIPSHM